MATTVITGCTGRLRKEVREGEVQRTRGLQRVTFRISIGGACWLHDRIGRA